MSKIGNIRRLICHRCPNQCDAFLKNKINHDDPKESCPVPWIGRWGRVSMQENITSFISERRRLATWEELHTYLPEEMLEKNIAWLQLFSARVPSVNCRCKSDWAIWVAANPPRWHDFFAWTVEAHNAVNKRLNKPILSVEEARKIWFPTN